MEIIKVVAWERGLVKGYVTFVERREIGERDGGLKEEE